MPLKCFACGSPSKGWLKVGMSQESMNVPEEKAWGTILADAARHIANAARHIANALREGYGSKAADALRAIQEHFVSELEEPTSPLQGEFVRKH